MNLSSKKLQSSFLDYLKSFLNKYSQTKTTEIQHLVMRSPSSNSNTERHKLQQSHQILSKESVFLELEQRHNFLLRL